MAGSIKAAWRAYHQGEEDRALTLFEEICSNGQSSTEAYTQRGLFLLKVGRFERAAESFQKGCDKQEKNPAPLFFLALAQELDEKRELSEQSLERLEALSPHHQGTESVRLLAKLRDGDPRDHLQSFGFGPQKNEKNGASLWKKLEAGLGRGDPSALPAELTSSSYVLGPILLEVEKRLHPLEIPKLERHPPILPDNPDDVELVKRSFKEEVAELKNSFRGSRPLRKGKSLLEKAYGMPESEEQRQLLKKALSSLRLARSLDPYGFRVSYHLGETYIFLAKAKAGQPYDRFRLLQAQTSFLDSSTKEGVNPYLLFYVAYIQHLLGRPELAIKYYREATKKFEKLPEAHYGEGQCQMLLGNFQEAQRLFLKATDSDLALARERLDLFASLLAEHGPEHFPTELPAMPLESVESESDPQAEKPEASVPEDSEEKEPEMETSEESADSTPENSEVETES